MAKTVLITGASSGFGAATAKRLAADGHRLLLTSRRLDTLEALKKEIHTPEEHVALELDVRHSEVIASFVEKLPESHRDIDVLINNAGLALGVGPAQEASLEDWDTMIDTNVRGLVHLTRAVLPAMVARNRGQVINMGSIAGAWPYPGGNTYGATKAFVAQFSRNMRADLLGTRVRVTNLEPGLSETHFSITRLHGDRAAADAIYKGTEPLTGDNIADIIAWLISTPEHVNINALEVMPTCQSWSPFAISRDS